MALEDIPLAIAAHDITATYNNVDGTYDNLIWYQPGSKPAEVTLQTAYETYINLPTYKRDEWFTPLQVEARQHLSEIIDEGASTPIVITVNNRLINSQAVPQRYLDYAASYTSKVISIQTLLDTAQDDLTAMSGITTVADYQTWYDTNLALIKAVV